MDQVECSDNHGNVITNTATVDQEKPAKIPQNSNTSVLSANPERSVSFTSDQDLTDTAVRTEQAEESSIIDYPDTTKSSVTLASKIDQDSTQGTVLYEKEQRTTQHINDRETVDNTDQLELTVTNICSATDDFAGHNIIHDVKLEPNDNFDAIEPSHSTSIGISLSEIKTEHKTEHSKSGTYGKLLPSIHLTKMPILLPKDQSGPSQDSVKIPKMSVENNSDWLMSQSPWVIKTVHSKYASAHENEDTRVEAEIKERYQIKNGTAIHLKIAKKRLRTSMTDESFTRIINSVFNGAITVLGGICVNMGLKHNTGDNTTRPPKHLHEGRSAGSSPIAIPATPITVAERMASGIYHPEKTNTNRTKRLKARTYINSPQVNKALSDFKSPVGYLSAKEIIRKKYEFSHLSRIDFVDVLSDLREQVDLKALDQPTLTKVATKAIIAVMRHRVYFKGSNLSSEGMQIIHMRYKQKRLKRPHVSKPIEIPAIDADQLMCTPISFDAIVEENSASALQEAHVENESDESDIRVFINSVDSKCTLLPDAVKILVSRKLEYNNEAIYPVHVNEVTAMLRQRGVPVSVSEPALRHMAKETVLSAFLYSVNPVELIGNCVFSNLQWKVEGKASNIPSQIGRSDPHDIFPVETTTPIRQIEEENYIQNRKGKAICSDLHSAMTQLVTKKLEHVPIPESTVALAEITTMFRVCGVSKDVMHDDDLQKAVKRAVFAATRLNVKSSQKPSLTRYHGLRWRTESNDAVNEIKQVIFAAKRHYFEGSTTPVSVDPSPAPQPADDELEKNQTVTQPTKEYTGPDYDRLVEFIKSNYRYDTAPNVIPVLQVHSHIIKAGFHLRRDQTLSLLRKTLSKNIIVDSTKGDYFIFLNEVEEEPEPVCQLESDQSEGVKRITVSLTKSQFKALEHLRKGFLLQALNLINPGKENVSCNERTIIVAAREVIKREVLRFSRCTASDGLRNQNPVTVKHLGFGDLFKVYQVHLPMMLELLRETDKFCEPVWSGKDSAGQEAQSFVGENEAEEKDRDYDKDDDALVDEASVDDAPVDEDPGDEPLEVNHEGQDDIEIQNVYGAGQIRTGSANRKPPKVYKHTNWQYYLDHCAKKNYAHIRTAAVITKLVGLMNASLSAYKHYVFSRLLAHQTDDQVMSDLARLGDSLHPLYKRSMISDPDKYFERCKGNVDLEKQQQEMMEAVRLGLKEKKRKRNWKEKKRKRNWKEEKLKRDRKKKSNESKTAAPLKTVKNYVKSEPQTSWSDLVLYDPDYNESGNTSSSSHNLDNPFLDNIRSKRKADPDPTAKVKGDGVSNLKKPRNERSRKDEDKSFYDMVIYDPDSTAPNVAANSKYTESQSVTSKYTNARRPEESGDDIMFDADSIDAIGILESLLKDKNESDSMVEVTSKPSGSVAVGDTQVTANPASNGKFSLLDWETSEEEGELGEPKIKEIAKAGNIINADPDYEISEEESETDFL